MLEHPAAVCAGCGELAAQDSYTCLAITVPEDDSAIVGGQANHVNAAMASGTGIVT